MAVGAHATIGKQLTVSGLILAGYIVFEMKKPESDNWVTEYINKYYLHPRVIQIFGDKTMYFTSYQLANFIKSNLWQSYFQFSLALSRLIDTDPEQKLTMLIGKLGDKHIKLL